MVRRRVSSLGSEPKRELGKDFMSKHEKVMTKIFNSFDSDEYRNYYRSNPIRAIKNNMRLIKKYKNNPSIHIETINLVRRTNVNDLNARLKKMNLFMKLITKIKFLFYY